MGPALIEEGQAIVRRCLHRNQPGAYQIQAAINAVHGRRDSRADRLAADRRPLRPAARRRPHAGRGPQPRHRHRRGAGPRRRPGLADELNLDNYHLFHATRADLLHRLGRHSEATAAYQRAADMAPTPAERDFLKHGGRASR
jgi:RNA polymerase sigma-70 factor, ECF subfamily